jgi:hypothetical protein
MKMWTGMADRHEGLWTFDMSLFLLYAVYLTIITVISGTFIDELQRTNKEEFLL